MDWVQDQKHHHHTQQLYFDRTPVLHTVMSTPSFLLACRSRVRHVCTSRSYTFASSHILSALPLVVFRPSLRRPRTTDASALTAYTLPCRPILICLTIYCPSQSTSHLIVASLVPLLTHRLPESCLLSTQPTHSQFHPYESMMSSVTIRIDSHPTNLMSNHSSFLSTINQVDSVITCHVMSCSFAFAFVIAKPQPQSRVVARRLALGGHAYLTCHTSHAVSSYLVLTCLIAR